MVKRRNKSSPRQEINLDLTKDEVRRLIADLFRCYPTVATENLKLSDLDSLFSEACSDCRDPDVDIQKLQEKLRLSTLLRKFNNPMLSQTLRSEDSWHSWLETEERLDQWTPIFQNPEYMSPDQQIVLARARSWIKKILGSSPTHSDLVKHCSPGPKSCIELNNGWFTADFKYEALLKNPAFYVGSDSLVLTMKLLEDNNRLRRQAIKITNPYSRKMMTDRPLTSSEISRRLLVDLYEANLDPIHPGARFRSPGSRFTTVPKTCTKLRPICVESNANMMFQRACGSIIRDKLRRFGLDLDYQHEVNRTLVRRYSDEISTIDLSAASDSIHKDLCKLLLPRGWYRVLDGLRAHNTVFRGEIRELTKISSMGNGFTFELETLIFLALTLSQQKDPLVPLPPAPFNRRETQVLPVSVFGDDIIVRSQYFNRTIEVLEMFGFVINENKSHGADSVLKESCGAYTLNNIEIPLRSLKDCVTLPDLIAIRNRLWKVRSYYTSEFLCVDRVMKEVFCRVGLSIREFYSTNYLSPENEVIFVTCEPSSVRNLKRFRYCTLQQRRVNNPFVQMLAFKNGSIPLSVKSYTGRWRLAPRF